MTFANPVHYLAQILEFSRREIPWFSFFPAFFSSCKANHRSHLSGLQLVFCSWGPMGMSRRCFVVMAAVCRVEERLLWASHGRLELGRTRGQPHPCSLASKPPGRERARRGAAHHEKGSAGLKCPNAVLQKGNLLCKPIRGGHGEGKGETPPWAGPGARLGPPCSPGPEPCRGLSEGALS